MNTINTLKGKVKKNWIDHNGHMNIAKYVEVSDNANDILIKKVFNNKKNILFVAKKFYIENKKELFINDYWNINSSIVKINKNFFFSKHEFKSNNTNYRVAQVLIQMVPINKKNRKIYEFTSKEIISLRQFYHRDQNLKTFI